MYHTELLIFIQINKDIDLDRIEEDLGTDSREIFIT